MSLSINHKDAETKLCEALHLTTRDTFTPVSEFDSQITAIVTGSHLTFRYVLFNGLLAKATDERANPLVLQAGSALPGAFDARSLCHKVLVPFEREYLRGALGASNEPFLNKPARHPDLKSITAVRKGQDRRTLDLMCEILPRIDSSQKAFDGLCSAMWAAMEKQAERDSLVAEIQTQPYEHADEMRFLYDYVQDSMEGETLALAVGTTMRHLSSLWGGAFEVRVHPVNQAGSSSNEFSDVDVYSKNRLVYAIEAKDKLYTSEDVQHAVDKIGVSELKKLMFVYGPHGILSETSYRDEEAKAREKGVLLYFYSFPDFMTQIHMFSDENGSLDLLAFMLDTSKKARLKDRAVDRIMSLAHSHGLIA